jgi:hypothetical protein
MARRTTWSVTKIDGALVILRNGRSVGLAPDTMKQAETYIRKHMTGGDKTQFVESDGYARPLHLRPA